MNLLIRCFDCTFGREVSDVGEMWQIAIRANVAMAAA